MTVMDLPKGLVDEPAKAGQPRKNGQRVVSRGLIRTSGVERATHGRSMANSVHRRQQARFEYEGAIALADPGNPKGPNTASLADKNLLESAATLG